MTKTTGEGTPYEVTPPEVTPPDGVGKKIELKKKTANSNGSAVTKEKREATDFVDVSDLIESFCGGVVQDNTSVDTLDEKLAEKLRELGIPLDERVRDEIAAHHVSQAWGAIHHIEQTWETISNPRGVFLYQLPRQQKEVMGSRSRATTAADWNYTLEDVKKLYPKNWREVLPHFGIRDHVN